MFICCSQGADLDSIVSSLSYAYLIYVSSLSPPHYLKILASSAPVTIHSSSLYLPVVNCSRQDLDLRKETLWLLESLGIPPRLLFFIDDPIIVKIIATAVSGGLLPLSASAGIASTPTSLDLPPASSLDLPPASSLRVTLLDHNSLVSHQAQLSPFVTEILDHHDLPKQQEQHLATASKEIKVETPVLVHAEISLSLCLPSLLTVCVFVLLVFVLVR